MRIWFASLTLVVALVGARLARSAAVTERGALEIIDEPYTPSPQTVTFVSLGYRELLADLLYIRLRGYYGGFYDTTSDAVATLGEAIVTLDPQFERAYDFAANAMTITPRGVEQATFLRAIRLLERGIPRFPANWKMPLLAGQIYLQDLKTEDPTLRRTWDEAGARLVESAIRKPGAPLTMNSEWVAQIRTRLGQRERAVEGLRELLLTTNNMDARKRLLARLAKIEESNADEIAAEILEMRRRFENAWSVERPALRPTMYILLGPPLPRRFDLDDLAMGGRELLGEEVFERLEPLVDEDLPSPP